MSYDSHAHPFLNYQTCPNAFAFGRRFSLSRAEWKIYNAAYQVAKDVPLPEPVEAVTEAVDKLLGLIPATSRRWKALKKLIRLYWTPVSSLVVEFDQMLDREGVRGANCLIPWAGPEVTRRAVDLAIQACEGRPHLRIFAPYVFADMPEVFGIKFYPSMEPMEFGQCVQAAERTGKPIISHCSPSGIRLDSMTVLGAKAMNHPGQWWEYIRDTAIRLCLAHGGGADRWMRWMNEERTKAGENWTIDNYLRETADGDWSELRSRVYIDTAFHDHQGTADYMKAVTKCVLWWLRRVLWGSDYPLHLLDHSYAQSVDWGRMYWPDQDVAAAAFLGVEHV